MHARWFVWSGGALLVTACFDPDHAIPAGTDTDASSSSTASTDPGSSSTTDPGSDDSGSTSSTSAGSSSTSSGAPARALDDAYFGVQGPDPLVVDAEIGLLANDEGLGILVVDADLTTTRGGSVSTQPGGGFSYTAPTGFWGADTFTYAIQDENDETSTATATIHVRPIVVPIAELPTHEAGYTVIGRGPGEYLAGDLRTFGDWNGDGIDDLGVVGNETNLYDEGSYGSDNAGPIYVVLGGPYAGAPTIAGLENDQGGFAIFAPSMSSNGDPGSFTSGDWNGDGRRDLAIVSPLTNLLGSASVVYGDQSTSSLDLAGWDFTNDGFIVSSFDAPLVGLGDLTGDGKDEIAYRGCNVILGADHVAPWNGTTLPDGVGFSLSAATCHPEPLGDVDGDGLRELLAYTPREPDATFAYVVWSGPAPTSTTLATLVANGEAYAIHDSTGGAIGGAPRWVSGGDDVNGDGRGDILINLEQATLVGFGKDTAEPQDAVGFYAGAGGFRIESGGGVSPGGSRIVGDVNGDGRADVLIVKPETNRAYVLYGGTTQERELPQPDGDGLDGFVIDGIDLGVRLRTTSGDWNGDGLADVAFGAQDTLGQPSVGHYGAFHVIYGVRTTPSP